MTTEAQFETTGWYALSVRNNKVLEARDQLAAACAETYVPMAVREDARGRIVPCPAVSRLLFVRTTSDALVELEKISVVVPGRYPFFVYRGLDRRPQRIPESQMRMFMLVSSAGPDAGLVYIDPLPAPTLKSGQRVRVTEGVFRGTEGYVRRVRRDRRVVVQIEGLCAVALPFIHASFLQPLPSDNVTSDN